MEDDNFTTLINELSSYKFTSEQVEKKEKPTKRFEQADVDDYFLNKTKALIDAGVGAVQDMTPYIAQGQDAKEIDALSKLVAATAQALDTLNKKSLIDKKADRDEQLEHIRIQGRKELATLQQPSSQNVTNNILVASREEIMKKLFGNEEVLELKDK